MSRLTVSLADLAALLPARVIEVRTGSAVGTPSGSQIAGQGAGSLHAYCPPSPGSLAGQPPGSLA